MKRVRLEFLSSGFQEILESAEIAAEVEDAANRIVAEAAGLSKSTSNNKKNDASYVTKGPKRGGYGGGRQIAYVAADNAEAYGDVVRNMILEKAINALRIH